ncbi:MAG TPA: right-handed parallel beta-helix repeat-containing protein [Ideonella sp.]|nr:right-handed parallel beta-helix repeat-containing protein [Ideonella sp.]
MAGLLARALAMLVACLVAGLLAGAATAAAGATLAPAPATTYYVRADGGLASQCDGRVDAAYRGAASGGHCAWKNPLVALPPGAPARIAGGDTLVIAAGSYMMGFGAPGADRCSLDWPWDCVLSPLPSGPDAAHPTRIVGAGFDAGCPAAPQLWGTERASSVISLVGTRHAQVSCLEITDHAGCAEFHTGELKCQRDAYPYGAWAQSGIVATDSSDVLLSQLNIHGLANTGIHAGRLSDWRLSKVRIAANGWAGWNGDVGERTSSNSGRIQFSEVDIEWNGCPETLADRRPAGCWTAYGDGLGTADTGGQWLIEDSRFRYNTQDGLDLLYHNEQGSVTLRRVWAEGNAGNQIKVAGTAVIENSVIVGNCGFFHGKAFTRDVADCRAAGDAVALVGKAAGQLLTFVNNTVISEGNTVLLFSGVKGTQLIAQNNVLIGRPNALAPGRQSADIYLDEKTPDDALTDRYNLKVGLRNAACRPAGTLCLAAGQQVLVNETPGQVDPRPGPRSPARASGLPTGGAVPADDLYRRPRPRGAASTRGAADAAP